MVHTLDILDIIRRGRPDFVVMQGDRPSRLIVDLPALAPYLRAVAHREMFWGPGQSRGSVFTLIHALRM